MNNPSSSLFQRVRPAALGALFALAAMISTTALAQFPGGGGGGGGPGGRRGGMERGAERPNAERGTTPRAAAPIDPLAAIQRELPSLKADLKLSGEQSTAWDAFAAGVRQSANAYANRVRREALARPREDAGEPAPALNYFATLADEDAQRAEAMRETRVRLAALLELLSAEQRKMFDRRIAQSQREPLGG